MKKHSPFVQDFCDLLAIFPVFRVQIVCESDSVHSFLWPGRQDNAVSANAFPFAGLQDVLSPSILTYKHPLKPEWRVTSLPPPHRSKATLAADTLTESSRLNSPAMVRFSAFNKFDVTLLSFSNCSAQ